MLEVLNEKVQREILPVDDGEPEMRELADAGCWVELEAGCWQRLEVGCWQKLEVGCWQKLDAGCW